MYGVGSPQYVFTRQLRCIGRNVVGELDHSGGRPELVPVAMSPTLGAHVEALSPPCGRQRGGHLRKSQATCDYDIRLIPQTRRNIAAALLDEELYEGAAVETDNRQCSASELGHELRHRSGGRGSASARSARSLGSRRTRHNSIALQALDEAGGVDRHEPRHWNASLGDHNVITPTSPVYPLPKV